MDGGSEIDGGGAGGLEQAAGILGGGAHGVEVAPGPSRGARRQRDPVGAGDADGGGTAHRHVTDRGRDLGGALTAELAHLARQQPLIENVQHAVAVAQGARDGAHHRDVGGG